MIITRTPLRISLFGGGTDFSEYYRKEGGCVLTSAINRYIDVIVKPRYDDKIRLGYSKTELVDDIDELEHELVRECLRKTGIHKRIEIATMGDIPSAGSGMGSSSAVTVGVLHALYRFLGKPVTTEALAQQACEIEIDILRKPIGVQDQYIAALGGQRCLHFERDGRITAELLDLDEGGWSLFRQNLMLFFTNSTRKAETILAAQRDGISSRMDVLAEIKSLVPMAVRALRAGEFDDVGRMLHRTWQLKKQLAQRISTTRIDEIYDAARRAGALGGKITGAGGGGFLLLYCPPKRQDNVRSVLHELPEYSFDLEPHGTQTVFEEGRQLRRSRFAA